MKKNAKNTRGVGRPRAKVNVPNKKFTFADLVEANTHVTPLTLRKFLKADAAKKNSSEVVRVKDENREPNSEKGLGRKVFVYCPRAKAGKGKSGGLKAATKSTVAVTLSTPAAPDTTPAPVIPEVTAQPATDAPATAPAPESVTA